MTRAAFFASVRGSLFGGRLNEAQVSGIETILDAWEERRMTDARWLAYILATAHHETGRRFEPIAESLNYTTAGRIRQVWPARFPTNASAQPYVRKPEALANFVYGGRMGNDQPGDGWRFRGRGYVQLTGRANYARMAELTGADLIARPDLAMMPEIAVRILYEGMIGGLFTGRKLADYFDDATGDWRGARRIVNGLDRADAIAGYGHAFLTAARMLPMAPAKPAPTERPSQPSPGADGGRFWTWLAQLFKAIVTGGKP